jgi:integrase
MGSIYTRASKDGSKRYYVRFKDEHGHWRSRSAGRYKRNAEKLLSRCEEEVANGTYGQRDITFEDFSKRWLYEVASIKVKPSTLDRYSFDVRVYLIPYFGNMKIKQLRPEAIQRFITQTLERGLKPRTVITATKTLGQIMKTAVTWEYITTNPVTKVERPRISQVEMDFLTANEVKRLLDACPSYHRTLFSTACLTGLRQGELFGLKWSDIDYKLSVLYVQRTYHPSYGFSEPKSERGKRAVQISPHLIGQLKAHQLASPYSQASDLVFPNANGRPMDYHNLVSCVFHKALEDAGLRRVRFHDLRHTYAALMISLGCNIKWLQRQMGHASLSTTMDTYGHILPDVEEAIGGKLDALVFEKSVLPIQKKVFH